jgi:hypothetical protein
MWGTGSKCPVRLSLCPIQQRIVVANFYLEAR